MQGSAILRWVWLLVGPWVLPVPGSAAFTTAEIGAAAGVARIVEPDVQVLASDLFEGRLNGSPGGLLARDFLAAAAATLGSGLGPGVHLQTVDDLRANVVTLIPGGERADEYVVVGAHYDHLGNGESCGASGGDAICNGAMDDAAGVAAVLAIGRALRALPAPPSRSVVLVFWDGEEHGLLGSKYFANVDPLVPLADVAAYVNFDIQGSSLAPSLRDTSFAIGAESGGELLTTLVGDAIAATDLETRLLSLTFGQGRSDYQPLWAKQVPVVFFTDATSACYHTPGDEIEVVDFPKLARQAEIGFRTVLALAESPARPVFAPLVRFDTYEDLLVLSELLTRTLADLPLMSSFWAGQLEDLAAHTRARVDAGPEAFGPADALQIAQDVLSIALNGLPCDPQVLPESAGAGAAVACLALAGLAHRERRS